MGIMRKKSDYSKTTKNAVMKKKKKPSPDDDSLNTSLNAHPTVERSGGPKRSKSLKKATKKPQDSNAASENLKSEDTS